MKHQSDNVFEDLMRAYLAGKLDAEGTAKLQVLLASDGRYQEMYNQRLKAHISLYIPTFEDHKERHYQHVMQRVGLDTAGLHRFRYMRMVLGIAAASLLGFLMISIYLYLSGGYSLPTTESSFTIVSVPLGGKSKVVLPDSTVVWLNAGSSLRYQAGFTGPTREVHLKGEGYFEVTTDKHRPFLVHTPQLDVSVLGTAFNVKAYLEDVEVVVSLLEGSVQVGTPDGKYVELEPDEQLVYSKAADRWEKREFMAAKSISWMTGKLYFDNATLRDIMLTLERYFDMEIIVRTERMDQERFSGSMDSALDIKEVLEYLDVDNKYRWLYRGNQIIVSDRR